MAKKLCRKGLHRYSTTLKQCPECQKLSRRKKYQENPDLYTQRSKEWYEKNKAQVLKRMKLKNINKEEKVKRYKREWRDKNQAHYRIYMATARAKRKAKELQAIPSWADLEKIKEIYKECSRLTKETGIKHHVDHIYPLQNKYLCGLHVETNLQIITAEENLKKGNRSWPGQLECQRQF